MKTEAKVLQDVLAEQEFFITEKVKECERITKEKESYTSIENYLQYAPSEWDLKQYEKLKEIAKEKRNPLKDSKGNYILDENGNYTLRDTGRFKLKDLKELFFEDGTPVYEADRITVLSQKNSGKSTTMWEYALKEAYDSIVDGKITSKCVFLRAIDKEIKNETAARNNDNGKVMFSTDSIYAREIYEDESIPKKERERAAHMGMIVPLRQCAKFSGAEYKGYHLAIFDEIMEHGDINFTEKASIFNGMVRFLSSVERNKDKFKVLMFGNAVSNSEAPIWSVLGVNHETPIKLSIKHIEGRKKPIRTAFINTFTLFVGIESQKSIHLFDQVKGIQSLLDNKPEISAINISPLIVDSMDKVIHKIYMTDYEQETLNPYVIIIKKYSPQTYNDPYLSKEFLQKYQTKEPFSKFYGICVEKFDPTLHYGAITDDVCAISANSGCLGKERVLNYVPDLLPYWILIEGKMLSKKVIYKGYESLTLMNQFMEKAKTKIEQLRKIKKKK